MNNAKIPLPQSIFNVVKKKKVSLMTSPLLSSQGRKSKVIKRNIHVYSRAVMPTTENSQKTYFF